MDLLVDQVWVSAWMWGYAKTQTRNHIITIHSVRCHCHLLYCRVLLLVVVGLLLNGWRHFAHMGSQCWLVAAEEGEDWVQSQPVIQTAHE